MTAAYSMSGIASAMETTSSNGKAFAYVGTYTESGDLGTPRNGAGIYRFDVDLQTGELSNRVLAAETPSPSWIVFHPSRRYLYAINEVAYFDGKNGSVSAFAVDRATGDLRLLNVVSSAGAGPAYMSVDATGKFIFVANYMGGCIAVLPIRPDGSVGSAVDVHQDVGSVGATHATSAPPGSFAISGHDAPHAHMILPDLDNRFVIATDLGQDRIYSYRLHHDTGKLTPIPEQPFVHMPTGDGPRHFAFHPNRRWFYSLQEEASTVAFFHYDHSTGVLHQQQQLSALPPGFAGTNFGSEIAIGPSNDVLYTANRLHDAISVFKIGEDGRLTYSGESSTLGDYPRNFRIDPTGNFLFACNQLSDNIACFRIDKHTGLLHFTGQYTPAPTPACIIFLA